MQQGNYQPLNNEAIQYGTWAGGAPLISMTSSTRRNNQQSSPPPRQNLQQQQSVQQQQQQQQQGQQNQTHMQNQSPLSRLAIHTQGAPLILAGSCDNRGKIQSCNVTNGTSINNSSGTSIINASVNGVNYSNGNNVSVASVIGNSIIGSVERSLPAQVQRFSESVRKPQQQQQLNSKGECSNGKVDGANIANIDSLSIASDESSGSNNSENSLPRIIKPRKRRKKDRKPAGTSVVVTEIPSKTDDLQRQNYQQQQQQQQQQQRQQNQQEQNNQQHYQNNSHPTGISEQSSIVTLKPYVPICYDTRYEQNWGHRRPPPQNTKESYLRSQNQSVSCNGPMQQQQHLKQQEMHHQQQEIVDTKQQQQQQQHHHQQHQRYQQRHVQVKVLDDKRNLVVPTTLANMLSRSMSLTSKPTITNTGNYHNRNHHHVAHHHHHHHHHNSKARNTNNGNSGPPNVTNGVIGNSISRNRYQQQQQHYHQSQHDYNESMLINCEDNARMVVGSVGSLGSTGCQCRYCDPSGLIWDVDQSGCSPFLTPPHNGEFSNGHDYATSQQHQQYPYLPLFLSRNMSAIIYHDKSATNGCEYFELAESANLEVSTPQRGYHNNHNNHRHQISCLADSQCSGTAGATISTCSTATTGNSSNGTVTTTSAVTMLRRSWSDPTSYFSEEITVPNRDVGVIGDRGQNEINRGKSSWPGIATSGLTSGSPNNSPYGNLANSPPTAKQGLDVSTEIVTLPNGHRDLEIKFYLTSPCVLLLDHDKSAFLDDGEDLSDIWSYHESKLQRDFRTLLQAEE